MLSIDLRLLSATVVKYEILSAVFWNESSFLITNLSKSYTISLLSTSINLNLLTYKFKPVTSALIVYSNEVLTALTTTELVLNVVPPLNVLTA